VDFGGGVGVFVVFVFCLLPFFFCFFFFFFFFHAAKDIVLHAPPDSACVFFKPFYLPSTPDSLMEVSFSSGVYARSLVTRLITFLLSPHRIWPDGEWKKRLGFRQTRMNLLITVPP